MESAIPGHLKAERTRHRRIPDDYRPPYPSFVARHRPDVKRVVMAYFGLQFEGPASRGSDAALGRIAALFALDGGPRHWDRARYVDETGATNVLSIAYWDDPAVFDLWFERHGRSWTSGGQSDAGLGTFVEILRPAVERYETLFSSTDRPEGVAAIAQGMSGEIQEHAYWGGMRDRIPLAQTDAMAPAGRPSVAADGLLKRVLPHDNICLIRSGQDWSGTGADERRMYLDEVEPVLREGMDFLRDDGLGCGCFANRYMAVVGRDCSPTEKSFGMGWWKSLADLERWSESHPTHVAIFGAAMRYLSKLGPAAKLKLYHEVTVAAADEQLFEYRNCHSATGMLRAAQA